MFVRDNNSCKLYDFKLNQSRAGLILNGTLYNKIANTQHDTQPVLFARI